ncbi:MAG: hypothetical protein R3B72_39055 [Polyangiaceae bacterium]
MAFELAGDGLVTCSRLPTSATESVSTSGALRHASVKKSTMRSPR